MPRKDRNSVHSWRNRSPWSCSGVESHTTASPPAAHYNAGVPDASPPTQEDKLEQAARACPLLDGDPEAWVACCTKRFCPVARRIAGDNALAEDVLQESWIKILEAVHRYRGGSPACSWVGVIVANTAKDAIRKRGTRVPLDEAANVEESRYEAPGASLEREEEERLIRLASEMVAALPETFRQVLEMRYLHGLSTEETARLLDTSRGNVSVRLHRAVSMLRKRLLARETSQSRSGSNS